MKNFSNYYITSCGKIWNYKLNRFIAQRTDKDGYKITTMIDDNGKRYDFKVHRLVAMEYIPNPDNLPLINHKDEIKNHNWINNLEWCTYKYNSNYGSINERKRITFGKRVKCIETGEIFYSSNEAGEKLGVDGSHIRAVCRGDRKSAYGYHWEWT